MAKRRPTGKATSGTAAVSLPFTLAVLAEIFKTSSEAPDRLVSRESGHLEFKESYNWNSWPEYARTLAGFSNAEGGFIVFGVGDKPRHLKGLRNNAFEEEDPGRIAEYLNDLLAPALCWETITHQISGKTFGLIYVHPAGYKPVIVTKSAEKILREGDIFYRYRGRTQRIKYAELRQLLEEQRRRERNDWLRHFLKVAKIGVENAAVMDVNSGLVTGPRGSFVIDESLLPKLKFVKEGEFKETSGAPTLKLVGDVKPLKGGFFLPTKSVGRPEPVSIHTQEIMYAFLDQERVPRPAEYIKSICHQPSARLPVYFFIQQARMEKDQALEIISKVIARNPSKERLAARIQSGDPNLSSPVSDAVSPAATKRREFRGRILSGDTLEEVPPPDLRYAAQAIRSFEKGEIKADFLLSLLKRWFDAYYDDRDTNIAHDLRLAICHVDKVLFDGGK